MCPRSPQFALISTLLKTFQIPCLYTPVDKKGMITIRFIEKVKDELLNRPDSQGQQKYDRSAKFCYDFNRPFSPCTLKLEDIDMHLFYEISQLLKSPSVN